MITMHAEISKRPLSKQEEKKHYQSVNMQMGRVQLDSDWNQAFEILLKSRARALKDLIGVHGSPNDGFRIDRDLILDHMDVMDGWNFTGSGSFRIDHIELLEGRGSFRIAGEGNLARPIPSLLIRLQKLLKILKDAGAGPGGTVRLLLKYKVSALDDATIQLALEKAGGADPIATDPAHLYPCNGWRQIELPLPGVNLDAYEQIVLRVATSGVVHLDRLALDPGLFAEDEKNDFYIQGGDGSNDHAGRYYVDGKACIKEGFETYRFQQDYPEPPGVDWPEGVSQKMVYLDVWHRTITAVEEPEIREVALGGPDTCTREQLVAQVKVINNVAYGVDISATLRQKKSGTLTNGLAPGVDQGECDFRPELDYTGLDNSLYRFEIHKSGNQNIANFKWSRNNGADLTAILRFESDMKSVIVANDRLLCQGDWVELGDDVSDLADIQDTGKHSLLAKITSLEHVSDGVKITLENTGNSLSTDPFYSRSGRHPKLRRWQGVESISDFLAFDAQGVPSKELEHGIRIAFAGDYFYHGDYWQFTARVNTRSIETLDHAAPMGPQHYYAPLSVIKPVSGKLLFKSCRRMFPQLTALSAADVAFDADACASWSGLDIGNVQQALEYLAASQCCADQVVLPGQDIQDAIDRLGQEGGTVFLAPGIHVVKDTINILNRKNITICGDGAATRVIYWPQEPAVDEDLIKNLLKAIADKEAEIKKAEEEGKPELLPGLKAQHRELLEELYKAQGQTPDEVNLRIQIGDIKNQMTVVEDKPVEWQKLKDQLDPLETALALMLSARLLDLFRITSSQEITLKHFLMAGLEADSLVAILEGSLNVQVADCDLLNLPRPKKLVKEDNEKIIQDVSDLRNTKTRWFNLDVRGQTDTAAKDQKIKEEIDISEKEVVIAQRQGRTSSCIRITNGCQISIDSNRMAAEWGVMQQGRADAIEVPMLKELRLSRNHIHFSQAGLELIAAQQVLIEENEIFDITLNLTSEEQDTFEKLIEAEIILDNPCSLIPVEQLNEIIDVILGAIFKCEPALEEPLTMQGIGMAVYALSESRIVNNKIAAKSGIFSFYSRANTLCENQIYGNNMALTLVYNLRTRVEQNSLRLLKNNKDVIVTPIEHQANKIIEKELKVDGTVVINTGNTGESEAQTGSLSVVVVHFSDSLIFKENRVQGPCGWIVREFTPADYAELLKEFGIAWDTSLTSKAEILLVRYFMELMGLGPAIDLLETALKIFNGGNPVDWIAYLVEYGTGISTGYPIHFQATSKGFMGSSVEFKENPFIKILVRLFAWLLSLKVVSRTRITHNNFMVDEIGIGMLNGITLGGVKLTHNRIAGAGQAAILWQGQPGLNNPELNGLILEAGYDIALIALHWLDDFLGMLLKVLEGEDQTGGGQTVSPLLILVSLSALYGIGQLCPNDNGQSSGDTGTSTDPNPFVNYIKELMDAIEALIKQLESEDVRKGVKDLASPDDQISLNQIQGGGNGIHNNLANCLIASNRISLDPGQSAIAELFGIGRLLSGYALAQDYLNQAGAGGTTPQDHSLINALGNALMNLNPNALQGVEALLAVKPVQWLQLNEMLQKIADLTASAPLLQPMTSKITTLQSKVAAGNTQEIKTAAAEWTACFKEHLTGFGMILEAPGVQVLENHVESKAYMGQEKEARRALGGILMTGGSSLAEMLVYGLLMEEVIPFFKLGGQGTRLAGNSLQWGTGHGLCFSYLPVMADLRIENNEIQNYGLSGILCDSTILSSLFTTMSKKSFKTWSEGASLGVNVELFEFLFMLENLRITGNEINQCFLNKAIGLSESPPSSYLAMGPLSYRFYYATQEGALLVRRAAEIHCARNTIRSAGTSLNSWHACACLLTNCYNVKFEENMILNNGRPGDSELFYPRGGAFFLGTAGALTIMHNDFKQNVGVSLLVVPDFSLINKVIYTAGGQQFSEIGPGYNTNQSLDQLLVTGNEFDLQDTTVSVWAKVNLDQSPGPDQYYTRDLTFSQNQVALPESGVNSSQWNGLLLEAKQLLFNGNIINGDANVAAIHLVSSKGMGIGNLLPRAPEITGDVRMTVDLNRW
jgi:hypothetical protein